MAKDQRDSEERHAALQGEGARTDGVRDFERGGDAGEGSHSAFGKETGSGIQHNDERLGGRGRNPGREESPLGEEDSGTRGAEREAGPGTVRGLNPPDRDDVGG